MFIQVIQGHVAEGDELKEAFDQWQRDLSPGAVGWLGSTAGITDDGMFIGLARFESADAARHNSERPEQHQWWMEIEPQMQQMRPDVIGGLVAVHGDSSGGFTQAVYFTSEKAAREGERKEPPPEVAKVMQEQMTLMRDLTYLDLKQPWLRSPGR
jgi:hypothetical protein